MMKKTNYHGRALFLILLSFFIGGMCQAQTSEDLKGVPIEESGLSAQEYNDILNTQLIELPSQCGPLTLSLTKVLGTTNDPQMKHMVIDSIIPIKNNPNKPQWSGIPYIIISEEGYDENN